MGIRLAGPDDVAGMVEVMDEAVKALAHPDWFVSDDGPFIRRQVEGDGFALVAEDEKAGLAGFLVVRIPGRDEENLGSYLPEYRALSARGGEEAFAVLDRVAHFESACVRPSCRGRHLQARLFSRAFLQLAEPGYGRIEWCMGTVHPDNQASLKSFLRQGFRVLDVVKKYGGLDRCVMGRRIRP